LDMEGNVTRREPFEHVTPDELSKVVSTFVGSIEQVPPIFSAIRKDGKKLYQQARQGVAAEDIDIPARQVEIHSIDLLHSQLPKFDLDIECGGGTYIRSLVRDIGYKLNSVATTTYLERTKHGQFTVDDALQKDDWSADNIYAAIDRFNVAQPQP
jgi:tRNA pseudouridine55 synthase